MKLSVVVPAHNEAECVGRTVSSLADTLSRASIDYEIVVVDDSSTDGTGDVVRELARDDPGIRVVRSPRSPGFGSAVRSGLDAYTGDAVAVVMADGSDSPEDVVHYHRMLEYGFDCVFGSRFMSGSKVTGYPWIKLVMNRLSNLVVRIFFQHGYNDTTNAFKAYRRDVIDGIQPLLSNHFNLTVEMPLKAIVRGYSFAIVPISWTNRTTGRSKLILKEMGSRYLFVLLYVFLEHHLSRGDYRRPDYVARPRPARLVMPRVSRARGSAPAAEEAAAPPAPAEPAVDVSGDGRPTQQPRVPSLR